jgi:hypothetical protein
MPASYSDTLRNGNSGRPTLAVRAAGIFETRQHHIRVHCLSFSVLWIWERFQTSLLPVPKLLNFRLPDAGDLLLASECGFAYHYLNPDAGAVGHFRGS